MILAHNYPCIQCNIFILHIFNINHYVYLYMTQFQYKPLRISYTTQFQYKPLRISLCYTIPI